MSDMSAQDGWTFLVVVVEHSATEGEIGNIMEKLRGFGFDVHRSPGATQTVLGAIGAKPDFDVRRVQVIPGVVDVTRVTERIRLASRSFKPGRTVLNFDGVALGDREVVVMAGPCAVESEEQIHTIARMVKSAGATFLRGGAFKPRTSPYSFQGLGEEGLRLLRAAADESGLLVITEVMDRSQIALVERYADVLQIGARNMQNFPFLRDLGTARKPVMLKRGMAATLDEWLMSAEYILAGGNEQVILCERGIRSFDASSRSMPDISAIPAVHRRSHLPIVADPSHGTGIREKVIPMARAAVAAGADGIMVEVHHQPEHALSDGAQSLFPEDFAQLMKEIQLIAQAIGRSIARR